MIDMSPGRAIAERHAATIREWYRRHSRPIECVVEAVPLGRLHGYAYEWTARIVSPISCVPAVRMMRT